MLTLQVLSTHAHDKSVLEIEFRGEEGTVIGPTLEFYSLVAAELQRKELGIWVRVPHLSCGTYRNRSFGMMFSVLVSISICSISLYILYCIALYYIVLHYIESYFIVVLSPRYVTMKISQQKE